MFNVYHLADATTVTLLGMFALWAVGSRRHWFVRTAVLGGVLLGMLLIPAYDVLVEFALEVLFIVIGMVVWRWWRRRARDSAADGIPFARFRPQVSLETLLLLMVVVAVVTTVAARAPGFAVYQWYEFFGAGVLAAAVALASVWVVCGQTRWWVRLAAVPPLVFCFAIVTYAFWISRWMLQHWLTTPSYAPKYWQAVVNDGIISGSQHWFRTVGLGMTIICVWLLLMVRAEWFDPFREADDAAPAPQRTERRIWVARWTASVLFVLVLLFPLYLFYCLLTPTPIPDLSAPRPNGYDDLLTAGRMVGESDGNGVWRLPQLPTAELRQTVAKNMPAFQLVHRALEHECRFPLTGFTGRENPAISTADQRALFGLQEALRGRVMLAARDGSVHEQAATQFELLRLAMVEARSSGWDPYELNGTFTPFENENVLGIYALRNKLRRDDCAKLAQELCVLAAQAIPFEKRNEQQRVIAENSGWEPHIRSILDGWSGIDRYGYSNDTFIRRTIELRTLIVSLAVRAFQLEHGRLPATLSELTPDLLPTIPADPFDGLPLKYRVAGDRAVLYSVGPDGVDNGGNLDVATGTRDITLDDLFPEATDQARAQAAGGAGAASDGMSDSQNEEAAEKAEP